MVVEKGSLAFFKAIMTFESAKNHADRLLRQMGAGKSRRVNTTAATT